MRQRCHYRSACATCSMNAQVATSLAAHPVSPCCCHCRLTQPPTSCCPGATTTTIVDCLLPQQQGSRHHLQAGFLRYMHGQISRNRSAAQRGADPDPLRDVQVCQHLSDLCAYGVCVYGVFQGCFVLRRACCLVTLLYIAMDPPALNRLAHTSTINTPFTQRNKHPTHHTSATTTPRHIRPTSWSSTKTWGHPWTW